MIEIYKSIWNSAGNSNTHAELSNVYHSHHADLVCIFEPVVTLGSISLAFWDSLDLSLTVVNNKGDLLRNMWIVHSPTCCSHYVISYYTTYYYSDFFWWCSFSFHYCLCGYYFQPTSKIMMWSFGYLFLYYCTLDGNWRP